MVEFPRGLPELGNTAAALAASSLTAGTRAVYASVLGALDASLVGAALDDAALAEYLARLFDEGLSPSAAALVVAAEKFQARILGDPAPDGSVRAVQLKVP